MTAPTPATAGFLDHLGELRHRLVVSGVAIVLGIVVGFLVAPWAIAQLLAASQVANLSLVQLAPSEALMSTLKLAVVLGLALTSPVWLTQVLRFVLPGLTKTEGRILLAITVGGLGLFALGVWFASLVILPAALSFLLGFAEPVATNQIAISYFLDFCLALLLLNGLLFELPLLIWGLAGAGVITSQQLLTRWREGVVVISVLSAVLTPSQDPASMVLVAGMLLLLVGASLVPLRLLGK